MKPFTRIATLNETMILQQSSRKRNLIESGWFQIGTVPSSESATRRMKYKAQPVVGHYKALRRQLILLSRDQMARVIPGKMGTRSPPINGHHQTSFSEIEYAKVARKIEPQVVEDKPLLRVLKFLKFSL